VKTCFRRGQRDAVALAALQDMYAMDGRISVFVVQ